jgi:D-alanyl-D-alanine-carboxypeptidase/D-alanyl-D-alanine-endopeptidase
VEMNPQSVFATTQLIQISLQHAFVTGGIDAGRAAYSDLRDRFGVDAFPEPLLNTVGYALLRQGQAEAAVVVFEYNLELYPDAWNAYDSLGEGLAATGEIEAAIRAYERSLEINPDNTNGIERLRELRGR